MISKLSFTLEVERLYISTEKKILECIQDVAETHSIDLEDVGEFISDILKKKLWIECCKSKTVKGKICETSSIEDLF